MPKQVIKTLLTDTNAGASDSQITIRKQFVGTTNASGAVSFSAGSNETFVSFSSADYSLSILTARAPPGPVLAGVGNIIVSYSFYYFLLRSWHFPFLYA